MVLVDLIEELVKLGVWYGQSSSFESISQLALIQLAILVSIDRVEQCEKLLLGPLDKCTEFCVSDVSNVQLVGR